MTQCGDASPQLDPKYGALVISLDFELHWGVRDLCPVDSAYRRNLIGARRALPEILSLFERYDISATWATVGFLFARNRNELTDFLPSVRPRYKFSGLDPYRERVGRDETEDPLHFAPSLLTMIRNTPRQDIGSHTFSHYFCLEEGETKESFEADLDAAQRIASGTMGIKLRSLALPRNQLKREYVPLIRKAGFLCYRGCQTGKIHEPRSTKVARATHFRVARFLDDYFPVSCDCTPAWKDLETDQPGLYDVRASRFLREPPLFVGPTNRLRAQRIKKVMRIAAQAHLIYHLWWHPHNFGAYVDESIEFLSDILSEFCELRDRFGFRSMSMVDAASLVQDLKAHALVPAGA